jgi:hypothetical protein
VPANSTHRQPPQAGSTTTQPAQTDTRIIHELEVFCKAIATRFVCHCANRVEVKRSHTCPLLPQYQPLSQAEHLASSTARSSQRRADLRRVHAVSGGPFALPAAIYRHLRPPKMPPTAPRMVRTVRMTCFDGWFRGECGYGEGEMVLLDSSRLSGGLR